MGAGSRAGRTRGRPWARSLRAGRSRPPRPPRAARPWGDGLGAAGTGPHDGRAVRARAGGGRAGAAVGHAVPAQGHLPARSGTVAGPRAGPLPAGPGATAVGDTGPGAGSAVTGQSDLGPAAILSPADPDPRRLHPAAPR